MALSEAKLASLSSVASAGSATYTCPASKNAYIRSIIVCNVTNASSTAVNTGNPNTVSIHFVDSGGTASDSNRIARFSIVADDTFFFEPEYPITLDAGDFITVKNERSPGSNSITVTFCGDVTT